MTRLAARTGVVLALLVLAAGPARAERWLAAELPAAWAVSDPQSSAFAPGALPALGLYQSLAPWSALGVRARAGALGDGDPVADGLADPGRAGLGTLTLAARLSLRGVWFEVAGGGGVTGDDWVPTVEIGAGYAHALGAIELGPAVRFVHVEAPAMEVGYGAAELALVGLELRRARPRPRVRPPIERVAVARPRPPAPEPAPPPEPTPRDDDRLIDGLASCRELAAVVEGGTAGDGCAPDSAITVHTDRIVLDEQVLFDPDRARVRRRARPVVAAIAQAWAAQRGWSRLIIEGHADVRGKAEYNQWLSQERADRTRAALIDAGVPADRIDAVGLGEARPRDPGRGEAAHARNRRVEFVIVTGSPRP